MRLDGLNDLVGESVCDGFLGRHVEVAIGVLLDLFQRLSGCVRHDEIEASSQLFEILGVDVDVHCGPPELASDKRLMDHDV